MHVVKHKLYILTLYYTFMHMIMSLDFTVVKHIIDLNRLKSKVFATSIDPGQPAHPCSLTRLYTGG
jgi:hypothetical protein